ncbi:DUF1190 domain-containing protein [Marinomonas sp. 15G1-11]|uniref:DUF1190 domain-containing protein n=1 Tax=Marinomonas phaeophyticola TaxID=3004091 RepID=A0ABT4JV74_9GAMM|nr:DUF1190 domain-containing protein [Marinomonas sp. 15G1-11]MCZ2721454.1 DUF1190 domain-containing protein [Marinomonas sp. 15G1-11]
MKRSKSINLDSMRKVKSASPLMRPLTLAIASVTLAACGSSEEEVQVVSSIEDCKVSTTLTQAQCEVAYQQALQEAERTGPKYSSQAACEAEFGYDQCNRSSQGSFFTPFMAGFLVSNLLDSGRSNRYNPVYRYPKSGSSDRIMTADGRVIGNAGQRSYKVDKSNLQSKPTVTRTVSRGGFGSVASAKSSWGGGKKSSWGG